MSTSIKYIGKREHYTDGTYGSHIEFKHGETQLVPDDLAVKLLKHPDQYQRGDEDRPAPTMQAVIQDQYQRGDDIVKDTIIPKPDSVKETPEDTQDVRDAIATMNSQALVKYAMTHYRVKLDKQMVVESLRTEVTRLVDQYGVD